MKTKKTLFWISVLLNVRKRKQVYKYSEIRTKGILISTLNKNTSIFIYVSFDILMLVETFPTVDIFVFRKQRQKCKHITNCLQKYFNKHYCCRKYDDEH